MSVWFRRRGRPGRYEIQLQAIGDGPAAYTIVEGLSNGLKRTAGFGNVGAAPGHISVLVGDVMPAWVLDPDKSTWTARFY